MSDIKVQSINLQPEIVIPDIKVQSINLQVELMPPLYNLKYWNGSAWESKLIKYWNGSAWSIT